MCGGENKKYRRVGYVCQPTECPIVCFKRPVHLSNFVKRFRLSVRVCLPWQGCFFTLAANGFGLGVRAGFGAQNCQPALNLNRSTKLQVCTSPRLTQNPC